MYTREHTITNRHVRIEMVHAGVREIESACQRNIACVKLDFAVVVYMVMFLVIL